MRAHLGLHRRRNPRQTRADRRRHQGIELRCGEAHVRITLDGKVHIEGNDIVSAAMCSNRIEGASIDLN